MHRELPSENVPTPRELRRGKKLLGARQRFPSSDTLQNFLSAIDCAHYHSVLSPDYSPTKVKVKVNAFIWVLISFSPHSY